MPFCLLSMTARDVDAAPASPVLIVNQMRILGIDVAKAKLDIALLLPDGKFRSEVVPNTPEGFEKLAA